MAKRTTVDNDEPLTRPIADELSAAVAEDLESFDSVQAERDSERAFESEDVPSSKRLLSFYDRLRDKILHSVEKRGGKLSENALKALTEEETERFRRNAAAWADWERRPPSYRKVILHWVTSAKKAETRERRLETLIRDSEAGRKVGEGDSGRNPD